MLRTARPAVCRSMTRAVREPASSTRRRRTVEPAEPARLPTREQPWPISRLDNTCPRRPASPSRSDAPRSRRKQPQRTRPRSCHPPRSAETRPSELLSRPLKRLKSTASCSRPDRFGTLLIPHDVSEKAALMTSRADRRRKQPVFSRYRPGWATSRVGDHGRSCVARPAHQR